MNLDFILFTPPKGKYSFMDFWGQVIFVPKYKKSNEKSKIQEIGSLFGSIFNCYTSTKTTEAHLTVDSALLDVKGFYSQVGQQSQEEQATQSSSKQEEQVDKYIPCLYLDSMVRSEYILVYFHASGEDIKLCHKLMNHLRNSYQINVIAMEYPGYSIHKGKPKAQIVNQEAKIVYDFVKNKLGFSQNKIIVMGRSIGTGVTLQLLQTVTPRALALISPFISVKTLAKQVAGKVGHYLAKEAYNNLENIKSVKCPAFILHGKKDELISYQNSIQLAQTLGNLKIKVRTHFPSKMTHSQFDYYTDLSDPLRQFLMQEGINLYKQGMNGPTIGEQYFQLPEGMKI